MSHVVIIRRIVTKSSGQLNSFIRLKTFFKSLCKTDGTGKLYFNKLQLLSSRVAPCIIKSSNTVISCGTLHHQNNYKKYKIFRKVLYDFKYQEVLINR